jgi:hypothetical protein
VSKRQSNRKDRRIASVETLTKAELDRVIETARYVGINIHKLHPGDYGFVPPVNPRPTKGVCDDLRIILMKEAAELMRDGIRRGMVSQFEPDQLPKYIWAIDGDGEVYEAKTKPGQDRDYHGYRLGDNDKWMRAEVRREWKTRCPPG